MLGYWGIPDRVIPVKHNGNPFNIAMIQAYTPTSGADGGELEQFYEDMDTAKSQCNSQDIIQGKDW